MANKPFRNSFAETIFHQKYAHAGCETWEKLCAVLAEDVMGQHVSKSIRDETRQAMADMKFIPGGRYLYYCGRPFKAFNNCLAGDTKVATDNGWISLAEQVNNTVNVLSPIDGKYYPAKINALGQQQLFKITFANWRGRSKVVRTVRATRNHRWPLLGGGDTTDLRIGDIIPANSFSAEFDTLAFAHGYVFGAGNADGQVRLRADKDKTLPHIFYKIATTLTYPRSAGGDLLVYFDHNIAWKQLPPKGSSSEYIASFIKGWIASDTAKRSGLILVAIEKEHAQWFRDNAVFAGLVTTGKIRTETGYAKIDGHFCGDHEIFIQTFAHGKDFPGFKVVAIEPDVEETVYCPFEPMHNRFVIDHGIDTYNCFIFKSEEDSREDWANLSWKAESALATGGGIGNDYSVYRPEGSPLSRTGGIASGPISKMRMIDQIGREVMQGGARRSAIYASLDATHPDARKLLYAKDWDRMQVSGTNLTVGDLKRADFNYNAPLSMTNISLNYKDDWLQGLRGDGPGNIFTENCRQAMRTGEPGFSFNFGAKQDETGRNACTEVTTADDSDVCNLASINLANITDIEDLKRVTELATVFLLCGTLVAHLPFKKVYAIREKNRRLGLGLMGVHEWLLQRGHKYEVTDELHTWLASWSSVADQTAAFWADKFAISRPVATRAIAPTGTIGILAGTTTGIEPVFAVAFKRRYLVGGTEWRYQYVIDSAAQGLIDRYGIDPDKIESAIDLAADYERRIKFQADVQDYVDMGISSTINLPAWGTDLNNEDKVVDFAATLAKYAPRLRGFTVYPDGARGGQPLTRVDYNEAKSKLGQVFVEAVDVCDLSGKGGTCGS